MLGNGLVAICAGLLANTLVDSFQLGPVAPFDAAAICMGLGGAVILLTWPENYGDNTPNKSIFEQFSEAARCIANDRRILLLGAMQVRLMTIICSVAVLPEISLRSPYKLFILIIKKIFTGSKYPGGGGEIEKKITG